MPKDLLDPLFGDGITENFGSALYATSSGPMDRVRELIAAASDLRSVPRRIHDAEDAYFRGLVHPGYVRLEDFRRSVREGPEVAQARIRREVSARLLADVHAHMSWSG